MKTKVRSFTKMAVSTQIAAMIPWIAFRFYTADAFQVFAPGIAELRGLNYASLLNWNTYGNIGAAVACLVGGYFIAKGGPKKVIAIASIICGLNFVLLGFYPDALVGPGIALNVTMVGFYCTLPTSVLISNWFPRTHSHVMGNVTASIIVSSVIILPIYNLCINRIGLTTSSLIFGIPMVIYGIVAFVWIKDNPQDVGLEPNGQALTDEEKAEIERQKTEKCPWTVKKIFTNRAFLSATFAWGFVYLIVIGISLVGISLMKSKGMSDGLAVTMATIAGFATFGGSIVSGYLAEKIGLQRTSIIWCIIMIVSLMMVWGATSNTILLAALGYQIVQVMVGASNNLMATYFKVLSGPRWHAAAYRYCNAVIMGIRSVGTALIGVSLTVFGTYNPAVLGFAVLGVVSIILIVVAGCKQQEISPA